MHACPPPFALFRIYSIFLIVNAVARPVSSVLILKFHAHMSYHPLQILPASCRMNTVKLFSKFSDEKKEGMLRLGNVLLPLR